MNARVIAANPEYDVDAYGIHYRGLVAIAERAFREDDYDQVFLTLAHEEAHAVLNLSDKPYPSPAEMFAINCQLESPRILP